eukprot:9730966-Lingulodinium_polyedra.AAC.1
MVLSARPNHELLVHPVGFPQTLACAMAPSCCCCPCRNCRTADVVAATMLGRLPRLGLLLLRL